MNAFWSLWALEMGSGVAIPIAHDGLIMSSLLVESLGAQKVIDFIIVEYGEDGKENVWPLPYLHLEALSGGTHAEVV